MYFNTNINLIRVPRVFSSSHPNEDKMNACRAYYRENHKIDRDIVVDESAAPLRRSLLRRVL